MNDDYAKQSRSYVEALCAQIAEVESVGEEMFDRVMLGDAPAPA